MISLHSLSARVGAFALRDVTFDVPAGAYGVVIGPAGSGKTTLLETIAGVVPRRAGRVVLGVEADGAPRDVSSLPPERRGVGFVYQHGYLFPHLSVEQNVAYGAADPALARDVARRLGADALAGRDVRALSGGERQLVAIARALARRPRVLLLDEPFSALDPRRRTVVRREVRAIHEEWRLTVLQVTHDFTEAGLLGEVAIVLDRGRVVQQGKPETVFRKPSSAYIADFLGAENVFAGVVRSVDGDAAGRIAGREDEFGKRAVEFTTEKLAFYALGDVTDGPAHAVIRAEEVSLSTETAVSSVKNQFPGHITEIVPAGALTRVTVDVNGTPIVAAVTTRSARDLSLALGNPVVAAFKATAVHFC